MRPFITIIPVCKGHITKHTVIAQIQCLPEQRAAIFMEINFQMLFDPFTTGGEAYTG